MAKAQNLSRRQFIISSAAASGGLALGFSVPFVGTATAQARLAASPEVNAWVVIKPDDTVVIRIARTEMGQGTLTGLAQLVAEELECDWKKVTTEMVTPGQNLARKRVWGDMITVGSRGIRGSQDYVRRGGAAARMMLLQAAADEWQVPVGELTVSDSIIRHAGSNRTTSYGKVADAAARLTPPDQKAIRLKDPNNWKIAGKPMKRLDTADKLDGSKIYAIDLKFPGMLNAAVKQCEVFGGKLVSFDESKIAKMPGVKRAVKVDDVTVAVVADTWWHAKTALDALPIVWDEGPNAKVTSAMIAKHIESGLTSDDAFADTKIGDTLKALASGAKKVEAVYSTPFLSHATMEPMTCTAKITADRGEAWVPTQNSEGALAALSETSGLPLNQCEVYRIDPGGGFGRRARADYVNMATNIAKQFPGVPVKMIWSREEDQMHGFYRPVSQARMAGAIDDKGDLQALYIRVSGQSINAFANPAAIKDGKDVRQLQGLWKEPGDAQFGYTVPNLQIEYAMRNSHVPVSPWRGVNVTQNGIYLECFMDELAKAANKDPVEFRRALMKNHPKHLGVLNAAAEAAGWGKPLPRGVHRGVAVFMGYASYSAAVAEVSVSPKGDLKVHRMVVAIDCGHIVNPDQIAAQTDGALAMGLSAMLYEEITIDKGRVIETNFHNYRILQLADMPKVETVLAPTHDFWGGVGEPTICVMAPAVMNAIFAATGKPVRNLPIKNAKLV